MKPQVHTRKHYVQQTLSTVLAGANLNINIATAVEATTANDKTEVIAGSTISAVYIEMWVRAGDTSPGNSLLTFYKFDAGQALSFAEQIDLHSYNQKNNIFYHTQGLTNDQDADAIPFIRQWFKIPKGKQRMALGSGLKLAIAAQALDNIICGHFVYKEQY